MHLHLMKLRLMKQTYEDRRLDKFDSSGFLQIRTTYAEPTQSTNRIEELDAHGMATFVVMARLLIVPCTGLLFTVSARSGYGDIMNLLLERRRTY
ncbi:unnamed protein product [Ambrosiozyma monospora]|uniref:Unnamed protein product n=1 Tax=Ambrosiozyma monospora TaxID=43982 RepID=A0ACB5U9R6_AMBMO|nr:unnamed protein product [Ambrosiozyma monospora]